MEAVEGISRGMLLRLAWAVATALFGGVWLWRRLRAAPEPGHVPERSATLLRNLVLVLCAFWAIAWLVIAALRLRHPFELEWIGGAMRDHCERILAGQPLYVPPSGGWFPYEYCPLYFRVSALLMRLLHDFSFTPLRLVSIASTLGSAALIFLWVRRLVLRGSGGAGAGGSAEGGGGSPGQHRSGQGGSAGRGSPGRHRPAINDRAAGGKPPSGGYSIKKWLRFSFERGSVATTWGLIAAGLFLASYRFTGAWYDVERLDMLFLVLSLLGVVWLEEASSGRGTEKRRIAFALLSALAFALSFQTKQQAILFIVGGGAALAWRRSWIPLAGFALASLLLCGGSVWALSRATDGWYYYYCFHVPLANGIRLYLAKQYLLYDLPLFAPVVALVALALWQGAREWFTRRGALESLVENARLWRISLFRPRGRLAAGRADGSFTGPAEGAQSEPHSDAVLFAMTAMGLAGSLLSRAHWGGDQNVLMTGYLFLGAAACVAAGRWEAERPTLRLPLYALLLAQLIALTYRPDAQLPTEAHREAGEKYLAAIRRLEREGEVLCLDHGGLTRIRHFQIMGLHDVLNSETRLPPAILEALRSRRYAAIVMDAEPGPGDLGGELLRYYAPAERLNITQPFVVTGFPTPSPIRPGRVLRPRP